MAEFERALIQERVRAGLRNARAKGRRLGRPRVSCDEVGLQFLEENIFVGIGGFEHHVLDGLLEDLFLPLQAFLAAKLFVEVVVL